MAIIKIPDGNAFKLRVTAMVNDVSADLNVVNNIIVNFVRRGRIAQPFGIDGNGRLVIANDGSLARGLYGVELTGYHDGKPWRHYIKNAFKIVDENEDADTPTVVDDVPVYDLSDNMSFGGDGVTAAYVDAAIEAHNEDNEAHEALQAKIAGKVDDVLVDGESVVETDPVTGKRTVGFHKDQFGKVDDVKVNGESVLNENNEAEITVPTKTSELDNDEDFATNDEVDEKVAAHMVNEVNVSVDNTAPTGQPSAEKTFQNGVLGITFKNVKGEKGEPLTWEDLSDEQKASLEGKRGESILVGQGDLPLTHELGESERKAMSQKGVKDSIGEELSSFTETETSIVDVTFAEVVDGKAMQTNGSESEDANWTYVKFPVIVGETYHIKTVAGQTSRVWLMLDAEDNVLSFDDDNSKVGEKDKDVTIPDTAAVTMVVNYKHPSEETRPLEVKKEVTSRSLATTDDVEDDNELPITSQGAKTLKNALEAKIEQAAQSKDITPEVENYTITEVEIEDVDSATITKHDGVVLYLNGSESAGTGWFYDVFPAQYGDKFLIGATTGSNVRMWLLLDANDNVIGGDDRDSTITYREKEVTIENSDTVKMVVNHRQLSDAAAPILLKKYVSKRYLDKTDNAEEGNELPITSQGVRRAVNKASWNILAGKTLVCCGCSTTVGADLDLDDNPLAYDDDVDIEAYQWKSALQDFQQITEHAPMTYGYQIAKRNGMKYYSAAVSGSTIQDIEGKAPFSQENGRYTKLPDQIDYMTLIFCHNDYSNANSVLGTIDDTTNQTYYGAWNVVLEYLINKYPRTKIALVVSFGSSSEKAANYRQAMRDVANKWGLACYDFTGKGTPLFRTKESSVGVCQAAIDANIAKYFHNANNLHPNYWGHCQLADMVEGFLRTI